MGWGGDRGQGTFGGGEGKTRVRSRGDGHPTREEKNRPKKNSDSVYAVSYTHLTLPTILLV